MEANVVVTYLKRRSRFQAMCPCANDFSAGQPIPRCFSVRVDESPACVNTRWSYFKGGCFALDRPPAASRTADPPFLVFLLPDPTRSAVLDCYFWCGYSLPSLFKGGQFSRLCRFSQPPQISRPQVFVWRLSRWRPGAHRNLEIHREMIRRPRLCFPRSRPLGIAKKCAGHPRRRGKCSASRSPAFCTPWMMPGVNSALRK